MTTKTMPIPNPAQIERTRVLVPMMRILDKLDGEDLRYCAKYSILFSGTRYPTSKDLDNEEKLRKFLKQVLTRLAENDPNNLLLLSCLFDIVSRLRLVRRLSRYGQF